MFSYASPGSDKCPCPPRRSWVRLADGRSEGIGAELERYECRGFHRSVVLLSAAAINMTQMVGIGPFITIPLMVATFGDRDAAVSQDRVDQGDHHRPVDCHAGRGGHDDRRP